MEAELQAVIVAGGPIDWPAFRAAVEGGMRREVGRGRTPNWAAAVVAKRVGEIAWTRRIDAQTRIEMEEVIVAVRDEIANG